MVNSNLEFELVKLKLRAAEAARLQSRRDELIEVFNKIGLDIPKNVKINLERSTNLDTEQLEEKVQILTDENIRLLTDLYLFNKTQDVGEMIKLQNNILRKDFEYLKDVVKNNNEDSSILEKYFKKLTQRFFNLDKEKSQLQDELIMLECRIDIMVCKLSHLVLLLQEPIMELRLKVENGIPITEEEFLILKVAENSISNNKLKTRINELKNINSNLQTKLLEIQNQMLQKLKKISQTKETNETYENVEPEASKEGNFDSSLPSIATSYSMEIHRKTSDIKPLAVAILGYHSSEL
uniref:Uncharacterized protein n=2 Tax=Rhodnius prolixus TaxID=13249 RepID=T1HM06_RHOPR